jgi:hypothetical protein
MVSPTRVFGFRCLMYAKHGILSRLHGDRRRTLGVFCQTCVFWLLRAHMREKWNRRRYNRRPYARHRVVSVVSFSSLCPCTFSWNSESTSFFQHRVFGFLGSETQNIESQHSLSSLPYCVMSSRGASSRFRSLVSGSRRLASLASRRPASCARIISYGVPRLLALSRLLCRRRDSWLRSTNVVSCGVPRLVFTLCRRRDDMRHVRLG